MKLAVASTTNSSASLEELITAATTAVSPAPTRTNICAGLQQDGDGGGPTDEGEARDDAEREAASSETEREKEGSVQSVLSKRVAKQQEKELHEELLALGEAGKVKLAQLRSQRGRGAMAWLDATPQQCSMGRAAAAGYLLTILCVEWGAEGTTCPYNACNSRSGPTSVHAVGCHRQHIHGMNATHLGMKRKVQDLLRRHHVSDFTNEDDTVFKVVNKRADTAIHRRGMALAATRRLRLMGFVLDTSLTCPTCPTFVNRPRQDSAHEDGLAARLREVEKHRLYDDAVHDFWKVVPLVHESYGRMGRETEQFLRELAAHSAACEGGSAGVIARRQAVLYKCIVRELSVTLMQEIAERILAYMRGAALAGRALRPVSHLLGSYTA
jgi:hypothetical protein